MIRGMEHMGLSVSDLDRSVDFYCTHFGLKLVRLIEPAPESKLGLVNGIPGSAARIAHLESEKAMVELFEYVSPRGRPVPADARQADLGYIHMGFTSTDVRSDYLSLKDRGVRFLGEPVEFRPGVWVVYFRGPDGEVCELRQT